MNIEVNFNLTVTTPEFLNDVWTDYSALEFVCPYPHVAELIVLSQDTHGEAGYLMNGATTVERLSVLEVCKTKLQNLVEDAYNESGDEPRQGAPVSAEWVAVREGIENTLTFHAQGDGHVENIDCFLMALLIRDDCGGIGIPVHPSALTSILCGVHNKYSSMILEAYLTVEQFAEREQEQMRREVSANLPRIDTGGWHDCEIALNELNE